MEQINFIGLLGEVCTVLRSGAEGSEVARRILRYGPGKGGGTGG